MKPGPKSTIPKGVQEGVKKQLAATKKHTQDMLSTIAENWGVTERQVKSIQEKNRAEINDLRQAISVACFELGAHVAGEMSKDLGNPEKMAETPFRDKAQALEKLVNAGVTAADGHKPTIALNFGDLREGRNMLAERDRRAKELKEAQSAQVL